MLYIYIFVFADTYTPPPPYSGHILPINFIADTWRQWFWSTLLQLTGKKKNPIETSSWCHLCQGLQIHISGVAFIPPPILVEPFSLITLALLLLSRPLRSARCCYSKSALGYWFSFWTWTRPRKAGAPRRLIHMGALWTEEISCPGIHQLTLSEERCTWQWYLR